MITNILAMLLAFVFMEFVAWSNHKYVMHGFLWRWHKDHHVHDLKRADDELRKEKGFEKNDLFFLIYAIPAIVLMVTGFAIQNSLLVFIAAGITLYGLTYFLLHDVVYHKRISATFLQKNNNAYTKAIIAAHRAHHKPKNAKDFQNYGLLIFPKRYFNA
jgi:beta-carotene 3-hydroxylase